MSANVTAVVCNILLAWQTRDPNTPGASATAGALRLLLHRLSYSNHPYFVRITHWRVAAWQGPKPSAQSLTVGFSSCPDRYFWDSIELGSMNSTSLIVPFTFLHEQGSDDTHACIGNARNLVEKTCSDARAVFITSWGHRTGTDSDPTQTLTAANSFGGVAIGCEDGTVFILLRPPEVVTPSHLPVDPESRSPSRPSSPLPHGSRRSTSLSRSSTPSSLTSGLSPFIVSPRARIVSGISAEQVQAPKNYVDFDEEPEKLKEYLKSGVRERSVAERFLPHFDKGVTIDKSTAPTSLLSPITNTVRSTEAKSLLSATQSPALTARSISVPPSPAFLPSTPARYALSLEYHTFPPRFGKDCAVSGLRIIDHGRRIVSLQEQG